jgi:hypothetical protein
MLVGFMTAPLDPLVSTAHAAPGAFVPVATYGASYGEWSARWWQWLLSIPAKTNPNVGGSCDQGQFDNVYFLPGTFGGSVTHSCNNIPEGKAVFFPLVNSVAFRPYGYETLNDLRELAAQFVDTAKVLSCKIDNNPTVTFSTKPGTANYNRVRSPAFTVKPPSGGVLPPGTLKAPGNTDHLVSDGYWVLISPLSVGSHKIVCQLDFANPPSWTLTYNLTVVPAP